MKTFMALPRPVQIDHVVVIGAAAAVLAKVSTAGQTIAADPGAFGFWMALTLVASFVNVRLPNDVRVSVNTAPLIAAVFDPNLSNPLAVCWIAFLGTFTLRDFRRELPWFGTLHNRANFVLSAFVAWTAFSLNCSALTPAE